MKLTHNGAHQTVGAATDIYTFRREDDYWYLCLPHDNRYGLHKEDLQLKEGALKILNKLANGSARVRLRLSAAPLEGADELELVEHCEAPRGGAIYLHKMYRDKNDGDLFWICDLALLVFGDMPERIYVQRLPAKEKQRRKQKTQDSLFKEQNPVANITTHPTIFPHQQIK